ncbi:major capsid protein [Streptomyces beijiangensis]|uniref:Major capsid protein n=1 Tax=Streptomyces beijiangensis TaxID=163361 RepID=A0A939F5U9_9ACTN|nr:major capsid protein [Streptomyces beijiangensis]MBO0512426.1 major capsid protein [Streptomyces beijiangensis]
MTIQDLLKDVTAHDLTTFARAIPTKEDFLLTKEVFPALKLNTVLWKVKDNGRYVNTAKYRAYDASVPFATREAWSNTRQGQLPPMGQKLVVGEQEQLLLEAERGADTDRMLELLYDDVERHVEAIQSRLELAAADVLLDGKLSINENGFITEADFGMPAGNRPTAPVPWSDPASDPIKDELGWLQYLDDLGVPEPEFVLTSKKAYSYLANNQAYRAAYYGSVSPSATPTATLNPQQVQTVRANYSLPPVRFYKAQVRVDGVSTKVLSEDKWIYIPGDRNKWANVQWGRTWESLNLQGVNNPTIVREDAPGLVITRGVQDDPGQIWTKGAAVAMPVMHTPDAHLVATVI